MRTFLERAVLVIGLVTITVIAVLLIGLTIEIFLLLFLSLLIAILLRAPTNFLRDRLHIPDKLALFVTAAVIVGATVGLILLLAPSVTRQFNELVDTLPRSIDQLSRQIQRLPISDEVVEEVEQASGSGILPDPDGIVGQVTGFFSDTVGILFNVFFVVIVGIYLAFDPRMYFNGLLRLLPADARAKGRDVLESLGFALGWWLVARLSSMAVVSILTLIGLLVLGIPVPLALAVIAGLLSFIPNIGPVLAVVPAMLLALLQGPIYVLYVFILYNLVQTVESYLITPTIERRTVKLAPAMTITIQLIMGVLVGLLGVMIAAPLLVVLMMLTRKLYVPYVLRESEDSADFGIDIPED